MTDGFDKPYIFSSSKVLDALLVFGALGLASVLIDIDHVPVLLSKSLPITVQNLIYRAGRPLHYPFLILTCAFCIYCFAHLYRLRVSRV